METRTELDQIRQRRGISAAELAKMVNVQRQTIYAIEAGDYVPNTTLALQLAQVLEVRVEDLFRIEAEPAPLKQVSAELLSAGAMGKGQPVQLCQVAKKLIAVPANAHTLMLPVAHGVVAQTHAAKADVQIFPDDTDGARRLLIAGCDPGISLLAQHLARFDSIEIVMAPSSSGQALEWLKQGKVHIAGTHLKDAATGEYNLPHIRKLFGKEPVRVVTFAIWEQGLVMRTGNPKQIRGVEDLARKDVTFINREKGAGSRDVLDQHLRKAGIAPAKVRGFDHIAPGHLPAALAVSEGEADCCIATRSAARAFGLHFLPLATERYDLVVRRAHLRLPSVQAVFDVLSRSAVRRKLEMLAGYDTSHTGETVLA